MRVETFTFGVNSPLEQYFWQLAETVYTEDLNWSPQSEQYYLESITSKHGQADLDLRGFVVLGGDAIIARAVTVVFKNKGLAWLGLFEAMEHEDQAVQHLFKACESVLKQLEIAVYSAPRLDHQIIGLQTGGFGLPQSILTPHHPVYYEEYFKQNGFILQSRSLSLIVRKENLVFPRLRLPWIKTRHFELKKLDREIEIFHELQTAIFKDRPGYLSRTLIQNDALIRSLLPLLDPELVLIAENRQGRPLGILIALPDHYQTQKPLTRARILSMGTLPEFQARGVGGMLVLHLAQTLVQKGYESAEVSWVLQGNKPPQQLSKRFGAEPGREFCLYQRQLD